MTWKDEEIDAAFRNAEAAGAPAFQEDFWTEMEALLPQKKKKVAAIWWFSGSAALVLLLLGFGIYLRSGGEAPATPDAKRQAEAGKSLKNEQPAASSHGGSASTATGLSDAPEAAVEATTATNDQAAGGRTKRSVTNSFRPSGSQVVFPAGFVYVPVLNPSETPEIAEATEQPNAVDALPANQLNVRSEVPETAAPNAAYMYRPLIERFYAQISAGAGQSAQQNVDGRSGFVHSYALGGGLIQNIGNMYVTFGVQARVDVAQNIYHRGIPVFNESHTDTKYTCLYSFETPLSLGYRFGMNRLGVVLSPGYQSGFTGRYTEYAIDNTEIRSGKTSGKIEQSKTLTMEVGLNYMRQLRPKWYLGCAVSTDVIRPFGNGYFYGESRLLPLNGSVLLRRTF